MSSKRPRNRSSSSSGNRTSGRGKPPISGQIKPGEVRNPYGRRGKNPQRQMAMDDFLNEKVPGSKYTLRETVYAQIVTLAAKGNINCIRLVIEHDERKADGEQAPDPFKFDPDKAKKILGAYQADVEKKLRKKLTEDDGNG
jgi:hypothetical protein